jgi:hypothetical protein
MLYYKKAKQLQAKIRDDFRKVFEGWRPDFNADDPVNGNTDTVKVKK